MKLSKAEALTAFKFGLVGLANTAVDYGAFMALAGLAELPRELAQVVSYSLGVANSYALNSLFTFKKSRLFDPARALRFGAVNVLSLGASLLVLSLAASWPLTLAKLAAVAASICLNYLGSRFWVFKDRT